MQRPPLPAVAVALLALSSLAGTAVANPCAQLAQITGTATATSGAAVQEDDAAAEDDAEAE